MYLTGWNEKYEGSFDQIDNKTARLMKWWKYRVQITSLSENNVLSCYFHLHSARYGFSFSNLVSSCHCQNTLQNWVFYLFKKKMQFGKGFHQMKYVIKIIWKITRFQYNHDFEYWFCNHHYWKWQLFILIQIN